MTRFQRINLWMAFLAFALIAGMAVSSSVAVSEAANFRHDLEQQVLRKSADQ